MHPAYSVILFTTASGAGYGLLVWLAVLTAAGALPADRLLGLVGLGLALGLVSLGLLASTAHLGRPERAWRAFSQWRTSWLSREGVAAVATYAPAGLFAIGWVFYGVNGGVWAVFGLVAAGLALVTVGCTGMIYQSLPTIRAWYHPLVTPVYLVLALSSGAVLANFVMRAFGLTPGPFVWVAAGLIVLAFVVKRAYWSSIDGQSSTLTAGRATGLERFGKVRVLEPPHTGPNYIMREMGYQVARKHAERLRRLVEIFGFALALGALLLSAIAAPVTAVFLSAVAVVSLGFGVVVERWLFFAEAQHIVTLYYGAEAV
jgi:DMSO reductase anchor subunit